MLYTGKGDNGTTKLFDSKSGERITKSSDIFEALGTLDELNSFLGLPKIQSEKLGYMVRDMKMSECIDQVQQTLFIIQAEVAGADMHVEEGAIIKMEEDIAWIEASLPPITTFFVSGGSELAALCDIARTVARRCERRVVVISEKGDRVLSPHTLVYLNRLSSLLYALARLSNHFSGITEQSPRYS